MISRKYKDEKSFISHLIPNFLKIQKYKTKVLSFYRLSFNFIKGKLKQLKLPFF